MKEDFFNNVMSKKVSKMKETLEILSIQGDSLILNNFLDYSEYSYSFDISISTNGFSYQGEIYIDNLYNNILDLEKMYSTLSGFTIFKENFMDTYIKFEMITLGHVIVEVYIKDIERNNTLKVSFDIDQTIIKDMIMFFKNILST